VGLPGAELRRCPRNPRWAGPNSLRSGPDRSPGATGSHQTCSKPIHSLGGGLLTEKADEEIKRDRKKPLSAALISHSARRPSAICCSMATAPRPSLLPCFPVSLQFSLELVLAPINFAKTQVGKSQSGREGLPFRSPERRRGRVGRLPLPQLPCPARA